MAAEFEKLFTWFITKTVIHCLILIVELIKRNGINNIPSENSAVGLVFGYTPLRFRNLYGGFSHTMPLIDKCLIPIPLLCCTAIKGCWLIKVFRKFGTGLEAKSGSFVCARGGGRFSIMVSRKPFMEGIRTFLSTWAGTVILPALISHQKDLLSLLLSDPRRPELIFH